MLTRRQKREEARRLFLTGELGLQRRHRAQATHEGLAPSPAIARKRTGTNSASEGRSSRRLRSSWSPWPGNAPA